MTDIVKELRELDAAHTDYSVPWTEHLRRERDLLAELLRSLPAMLDVVEAAKCAAKRTPDHADHCSKVCLNERRECDCEIGNLHRALAKLEEL